MKNNEFEKPKYFDKKRIQKNFKNFLIPSQENDFQPYVLRPKRVGFYAGASFLIKIILISFLLAMPTFAWLSPDVLKVEAHKIITLTNKLRIENQLNILKENVLLDEAAYRKTNDMITYQYFSHTAPDGRNISDWLKAVNYDYTLAGENLAISFLTAEDVMNAWENSPLHRENLLEPKYEDIGVGILKGNFEGVDTILIAQYFGTQNKKISQKEKHFINKLDSKLFSKEESGGIKIKVKIFPLKNFEKIQLNYLDKVFDLKKNDDGSWSGEFFIKEKACSPFGKIILYDKNKKKKSELISCEKIKKPAFFLLNKYFFIKSNPAKVLKPLLIFSNRFLKILLAFFLFFLFLAIFVEIKHQRKKIIFPTLALIFLLFFLIYF